MSFFSASPLAGSAGASWGDDEDDDTPISTEARTPFADEQDGFLAGGFPAIFEALGGMSIAVAAAAAAAVSQARNSRVAIANIEKKKTGLPPTRTPPNDQQVPP